MYSACGNAEQSMAAAHSLTVTERATALLADGYIYEYSICKLAKVSVVSDDGDTQMQEPAQECVPQQQNPREWHG